MTNEEFINDKIAEVEEKIKKTTSRNSKIRLIEDLICTFFGILGGIIFIGGVIPSGIGCLSLAIMSFLSKDYNKKKTTDKITNLNFEKAHLIKVKTEGINASRELNTKRKRKIYELKKEQEKLNKENKKKNKILAISGATIIVGGILYPVVGIIIAGGVGLLSGMVAGKTAKAKLENNKVQARLSTRIANLKNDLSIIAKSSKRTSQAKQSLDLKDAKEKIDNTKSKHITPEQEKLVDDYIRDLENESSKTGPQQKVKR